MYQGERPSFVESIRAKGPGAVIAEFKPASPSKGVFKEELNPLDYADAYAKNGAAAISVLTEHVYFKGTPDFLFMMNGPGVPLLRKDFILDPLQVAVITSYSIHYTKLYEESQITLSKIPNLNRFL